MIFSLFDKNRLSMARFSYQKQNETCHIFVTAQSNLEKMDNISVKKNIAGIRIRKGLSQEAAAEKMGISRTAYRNIESGDTRLISDSIGKMAEVFGVSVEEILLGYEPVREDSDLLKDMKMRYGEKIRTIETGHADETGRLNAQIKILQEFIEALQETVRTKDEVIAMLRKNLADAGK